jgi:hypothetical protein
MVSGVGGVSLGLDYPTTVGKSRGGRAYEKGGNGIVKKILILLVTTMIAFAGVAAGGELDAVPWNQANLKTLRAMGKHAVFRFLLRQADPDNEMEWKESDLVWCYNWYRAGDGKYELAIGYASGPDVGN